MIPGKHCNPSVLDGKFSRLPGAQPAGTAKSAGNKVLYSGLGT